jgi:hypothetical protein
MEDQTQVATEQSTGTPAPAPELTLTDLANLRSVVDVAVRRGAYAATEISAVGAIFDKLNAFLNAVAPQTPDAQPAAAE